MASEKFDHRVDAWMTQADAEFIEAAARVEATTSSAIMRRLVRMARYQTGSYQPQPQPAE
jgi:hypothetical protein